VCDRIPIHHGICDTSSAELVPAAFSAPAHRPDINGGNSGSGPATIAQYSIISGSSAEATGCNLHCRLRYASGAC